MKAGWSPALDNPDGGSHLACSGNWMFSPEPNSAPPPVQNMRAVVDLPSNHNDLIARLRNISGSGRGNAGATYQPFAGDKARSCSSLTLAVDNNPVVTRWRDLCHHDIHICVDHITSSIQRSRGYVPQRLLDRGASPVLFWFL